MIKQSCFHFYVLLPTHMLSKSARKKAGCDFQEIAPLFGCENVIHKCYLSGIMLYRLDLSQCEPGNLSFRKGT
jgi:hypothetical protein